MSMSTTPMPPKKPRKRPDLNKPRLSQPEYAMLTQTRDAVQYLCQALDQDDPTDVGDNKMTELLEVISGNMEIIIDQNPVY